jgi:sugar O-acyltransferase (sialic acid O-acetyltransferase NeuD family)
MRIIIVGAGGHGLVVADILESAAGRGKDISVAGFVDDDERLWGRDISGFPVLGAIDGIPRLPHEGVIVAIGGNAIRRTIFERMVALGEHLAVAQHPDATVARGVTVGPGSMICAGVRVNPGSEIGADVILNTGCTIDHHNIIGAHTHIAPGVHLGGNVAVGDGSLIGIGSTIMPGIRIGRGATVGAGALVHRDVADHEVVVGVPAKPIARR